MVCKMLFFDYRRSEEKFFSENHFDNFEIKFFKESLCEETLELLSEDDFENAMIISVFINSPLKKEIISRFKNLRVISTRSTGYDHICVNTCAERNIALINVESYGEKSVAQYAMACILMLIRRIYSAVTTVVDENFQYKDFCGRDTNNLTLGVVGTGAIGASVCRMAKSFGMRVLAYDIRQNSELVSQYGVEYTDLDVLLRNSDVVTLHLPYTQENYHMFSRGQFELMKDGVYFVNVARGEIVNTEDLYEFAKMGKFSGIALDVVACPDTPVEGERDKSSIFCIEKSEAVKALSKLDNVIVTPHMAYNTQESIDYILKATFEGISDYMSGGFKSRVV